jgi:hypothetical protein
MKADPSVIIGAIIAVVESLLAVLVIFDILKWSENQVAAIVGLTSAVANLMLLIWVQKRFTLLQKG